MKFSEIEKRDLLKAWLFISLAFGIVLARSGVAIPYALVVAAVGVGLGFLVHEMAHKFMAQKYHCWAEFRANQRMLWLALIMSFFGFVFAAPGAVMIQGHVNKKQRGLISLAGPLSNVVFALLFIPFAVFAVLSQVELLILIAQYGFMINVWLALFNMIPFGWFDGKKILDWSKPVYGVLLGITLILMFVQYVF